MTEEERLLAFERAKTRLAVNVNHVPPPYSEDAADRLFAVWQAFAASQNYSGGVDIYVTNDKEPPVREFFPSPSKLLFLGCGGGAEVKMAIDMGHDAWGVTLNPNNEKHAREVFGLRNIWYGDAHLMPEEWADSFDGAFGFQFLEHSPAPIIMLLEVRRVLRPGGLAYFETPGPKGWTLDSNLHHTTCPTVEQVGGWLLKAGFVDSHVKQLGPEDAARHIAFRGRKG